jgi:hypothetical protein
MYLRSAVDRYLGLAQSPKIRLPNRQKAALPAAVSSKIDYFSGCNCPFVSTR